MILLDKNKVVAVVGASNNPDKYGYKIIQVLKAKGVKVFPINRKADCIQGLKPYARLQDLPQKPDIINFVVPPEITLLILSEVKNLGWDNVWFQPGSFNEQIIDLVKEWGLNYEAQACILLAGKSL